MYRTDPGVPEWDRAGYSILLLGDSEGPTEAMGGPSSACPTSPEYCIHITTPRSPKTMVYDGGTAHIGTTVLYELLHRRQSLCLVIDVYVSKCPLKREELFVVSAQEQSFDPSVRREDLIPLVMQMHREHLVQHPVQPATFFSREAHCPSSVGRIGRKGVGEAVVETTCMAVREAEREDLEGWNGSSDESTP